MNLKNKIAILGAGRIGTTIAEDLSTNFEVTYFDLNINKRLSTNKYIKYVQTNLSNYTQYPTLLTPFDLVVSAVPGYMGFNTLQAIIQAGKNVADISFFEEDGLQLHKLAIQNNVTAIFDCGVAPGMSNFILGYYNAQININSFECMVGGLPKIRVKPFEYKAPFSPIDVIEEYTRPARYIENGHVVTKPALSDAELLHFTQVGTLECFNTDGLRSILHTMAHIPNIKEKTLRYPGHIALIQALQQIGFFNKPEINIEGKMISPLALTNALLFKNWLPALNEQEFTIMKMIINGENKTISYLLYDEYDQISNTSSMSRTTGYACNAFAHLILNNLFTKKGTYPPELIGHDGACFQFVMNYLAERNVHYKKTEM